MVRFLLLIAALMAPIHLLAATYDPSLTWRVIDTPHFQVLYYDGEEAFAGHAAAAAETAYARVTALLQHAPRTRTAIIVADITDEVLGLATTFPNYYILVSPAPPHPAAIGDRAPDWLALVLTHEYTHIVQLDMTGGLPWLARKIFGHVAMNNGLQPLWAVEGLAVYSESKFTPGGRAHSPSYEMMLRAQVEQGRLLRLDQVNNYALLTWPAGTAPYLYGSSLCDYIGEPALTDINQRFKYKVLPLFSDAVQAATGRSAFGLYQEWQDSLTTKFRRELDSLKNTGLTPVTRVTGAGYLTGGPAWFPSGQGLAYVRTDIHRHPQVRLRNIETGEDVKLCNVLTADWTMSLDVASNSDELAYADRRPYAQYYDYSDIFVYDFRTHRTSQVTDGRRASDPAWSPDAERLVFVAYEDGHTNLYTIAKDGSDERSLTRRTDCLFTHPAWSPEGNRLAVSVKKDGQCDLWLYDFTRPDSLQQLTHDPAADLFPSWSPDGKYILFSSDRGGIFNLYTYSLVKNRAYQLTNVTTGALAPVMARDGQRIAFTGYTAGGYDVFTMEVRDGLARECSTDVPLVLATAESTVAPAVPAASALYRPFGSLLPRWWLPMLEVDHQGWAYGLVTGGQDLLERHAYQLTAVYGTASQRLWYQADYSYSRYRPLVSLSAYEFPQAVGYTIHGTGTAADSSFYHWQARQGQRLTVTFPSLGDWLSALFYTSAALGFRHDEYRDLTGFPFSLVPWEETGTFATLQASCAVRSYNYYLASVAPEDGFTLYLSAERAGRFLGSDFDFTHLYGELGLYKQVLLPHHVLAATGAWEKRFGDQTFHNSYDLSPRAYGWTPAPQKLCSALEYHLPLWYPERGYRTWMLFVQKISGRLFLESGWRRPDTGWSAPQTDWGGGLAAGGVLFHHLPAQLELGYIFDKSGATPYFNFIMDNVLNVQNKPFRRKQL